MRRITFKKYNKKIEITNIINLFNSKPSYGQTIEEVYFPFAVDKVKTINSLQKNKQISEIEKVIDNKLLKIIINKQIEKLNIVWLNNVEKKFFQATKQFYEIDFEPSDKFSAYFTYMRLASYEENKNFFFISIWTNPLYQITTIAHEVLHLLFIKYYKQHCTDKNLTKNQFEHLKEALTFVLNTDLYKNVIIGKDIGYPNHAAFRKLLTTEWHKNKKFGTVLDCGISYVKKNYK